MNSVAGVVLPPVSAEFIHELRKAFPAPTITKGFDRDTALWDAACQYVVEWIVNKSSVQAGSQDDPVAAQQARVRYGS